MEMCNQLFNIGTLKIYSLLVISVIHCLTVTFQQVLINFYNEKRAGMLPIFFAKL
jgi:hypothetical protein